MEVFSRIRESLADYLADGRLGANLIAAHGLITLLVLASLILRRLLVRGGSRLACWTGLDCIEQAGEAVARRARVLLFWLTLVALVLTVVASVGYHVAGQDIREDLAGWYHQLTPTQLFRAGLRAGGALTILALTWIALRIVRRIWPRIEAALSVHVRRPGNAQWLGSWFGLLHWYTVTLLRLAALGAVGALADLDDLSRPVCYFLFRILTILVVARLLSLACRVLTHLAAEAGGRYLGHAPFRPYWERLLRLFPFGERCFEVAVYVAAASLGVRELRELASISPDMTKWLSHKIAEGIECVGIFFVTRVLIDLLQVLFNDAFGLYREDAEANQKARTVVPLLVSFSQYVLYFGAALVMLHTLEIDTTPILAGLSIAGLAVGLGAQNLVKDLVSGFFILFENQYLVGDFVQIGDAVGTVEEVGIRVTQVRDGQGKLYIIPNGQVKGVVSYSKGYVNAVVDVHVPSGSDLEGVMRAMTEAGRRLRKLHAEVLAETQIHGLVELGTTEMTIRAVTKVRPGAHAAMQNQYRRLLKEVFDQEQAITPRLAAAA